MNLPKGGRCFSLKNSREQPFSPKERVELFGGKVQASDRFSDSFKKSFEEIVKKV